MPTAAIQLLKPHPAQMRTTYDIDSLATLTLQVYERGVDEWQRARGSQFSLPVNGNGVQFAAYREQKWQMES